MDYYNGKIKVNSNLDANESYFQQEKITNLIMTNLRLNKEYIMSKNPFKQNYNNNNDVFLHIRLGDAIKWNVGIHYYDRCLKMLKYDRIFIASD